MHTFPELLKQLREKSSLTQKEFAQALGVSAVLIAMIETGQKEASKGFVKKLAGRLGVQPGSIMPFIFTGKDMSTESLSRPEKALLKIGQELQTYLINIKSKNLKKYV